MTRCLFIATIATLAGAIAALFWAFVKVGGDFRERLLPAVEDDWCGIHGWTHVSGCPGCAHRKGIPGCAGSWEAEPEESQADTLRRILGTQGDFGEAGWQW